MIIRILLFLLIVNNSIIAQNFSSLDTVINLQLDNVHIKVYGENYRFYDSLGFLCYSIKLRNKKDILAFDNGQIIKLSC